MDNNDNYKEKDKIITGDDIIKKRLINILLVCLSVFLLITIWQTDDGFVRNSIYSIISVFGILSGIVLVFNKNRSIHIIVSLILLGLNIYALSFNGISVISILLIAGIMFMNSDILMGFSLGSVLWICTTNDNINVFTFLRKYDLTWIVIILLIVVCVRLLIFNSIWKFDSSEKVNEIISKSCICLFCISIVGVVLWMLGLLKIITIPLIITHIHIVRTGIISLCIIACFWRKNVDDNI